MDTLESKKGHGQRMRKLENAFHVTVKYAFRGMPLEEFQTYFPPGSIPPHHTEAAYNGYRQCLHQTRIHIDREFEDVCEEHHIADKLQSLEVMCAQQGIMDGAPIQNGNQSSAATKMTKRAALKAKNDSIAHLAAIHNEVQRKNDELQAILDSKKQAARSLVATLEPLKGELADIPTIIKDWSTRTTDGTGAGIIATTPGPVAMTPTTTL